MNITVTYEDIFKQLIQRLTNVDPLWRDVTSMMKRATGEIFDSQGGTWGVRKWLPISPSIYGRIRIGTDGKTWGLYNESTRTLQASGDWRKSFRRTSKSPLSMKFGSTYSFTTTGKNPKKVSGEVLPYAGRGAKQGGRQPLPDPESGRFRAELQKVENKFLNETIARAVAGAATKKV